MFQKKLPGHLDGILVFLIMDANSFQRATTLSEQAIFFVPFGEGGGGGAVLKDGWSPNM